MKDGVFQIKFGRALLVLTSDEFRRALRMGRQCGKPQTRQTRHRSEPRSAPEEGTHAIEVIDFRAHTNNTLQGFLTVRMTGVGLEIRDIFQGLAPQALDTYQRRIGDPDGHKT